MISSSLLSPSLSAHHSVRPSKSFSIPGKLHHSRTSSTEDSNPLTTHPRTTQAPDSNFGAVSLTATAAAVFLSIGYPILSFSTLLAASFFIFDFFGTSDTPKHDMSLVSPKIPEASHCADFDPDIQRSPRFIIIK